MALMTVIINAYIWERWEPFNSLTSSRIKAISFLTVDSSPFISAWDALRLVKSVSILSSLCSKRSKRWSSLPIANFVQSYHKYGKMKKIKDANKIWQHIPWMALLNQDMNDDFAHIQKSVWVWIFQKNQRRIHSPNQQRPKFFDGVFFAQ